MVRLEVTSGLPYRSVMDEWPATGDGGNSTGNLPKADRGGLTHLERYLRREAGRNRVDTTGLTGRAGIGRIQR